MKKALLFIAYLFLFSFIVHAQTSLENSNVLFVVDSIPVIDEPEEEMKELSGNDVATITVIKHKDSLKTLGYEQYDGVVFVFTKAYQGRPEAIKNIPSSKQMERKSGIWYFRGIPYSGSILDYYYNGSKQGEGSLKDGKVDGVHKVYFPNGKLAVERTYAGGVVHGLEQEFYEDGALKQKGAFKDGLEEGLWEKYFPNGQVQQRNTMQGGKIIGDVTLYYSTGKLKAVQPFKDGEPLPTKENEKRDKYYGKGHDYSRERDFRGAIKSYSKALELDSTYANAYFARGTAKLNDFQFEEALEDFDKALIIEPYMKEALTNRAFCRIRKYQFGGARKLSSNSEVTILASKDVVAIPDADLALICSDLEKASLLGDKSKMVKEAIRQYCAKK